MNETLSDLKIAIKPRSGQRAKNGHPWLFSNEIEHPKPLAAAGQIVSVMDEKGHFFGYASYNPHSLISLRILSRHPKAIPGSVDWFARKIESARQLRERMYPQRRSYRLLYGDSDGLPGVIADKYEDVLSVQVLTAAMETLTENLLEALKQTMNPRAIVLRNQSDARTLEGLPLYVKVVHGEISEEVIVDENGIQLGVDVMTGQKTGHFFDQADNRQALLKHAAGAEVLDVFCYTGAWTVHLLKAGAKRAVAIDTSEPALQQAERNAERNGVVDRVEYIEGDAFAWLSDARRENLKFDVVITDPPSFAKNAKQVHGALRGYEDLNRQAIHLMREGGILCACSCSHHVSEEAFLQALQNAAFREGKRIRVLEIRGQAADHPILLSMPESRYLKCVIGMVERE